MFNPLIDALLYEILKFLNVERNFFTLDKTTRLKKCEPLKIPAPFKNQLSETTEEQFLHDLNQITHYRNGKKNVSLKKSGFFKSLIEFLTQSFGIRIDAMHESYHLSETKRREICEKLIPSNTPIAQALKNILLFRSYQEIASAIEKLTQQITDSPYLLIQSPREMDLELKKEIRTHLAEHHPLSFPAFQINRKLIGGFRLFKDGETLDYSWLTRVLQFTSLAHKI